LGWRREVPTRKAAAKRPSQSGAVDALRRSGLRLTPQRTLILATVESYKSHFCAEDIYLRVRERFSGISPSTVYRTLDQLEKVKLIVKSDMGAGKEQYHWSEEGRHHHLVCLLCGVSVELESGVVDSFKKSLQDRYGFQSDLSHMAIFGRCAGCQRKGEVEYGT